MVDEYIVLGGSLAGTRYHRGGGLAVLLIGMLLLLVMILLLMGVVGLVVVKVRMKVMRLVVM